VFGKCREGSGPMPSVPVLSLDHPLLASRLAYLPFEHMNESTSRPSAENSTEHTDRDSDTLDTKATVLLAIQAASSSFSYRAAEFAYPL
jgi:hypothetical protein